MEKIIRIENQNVLQNILGVNNKNAKAIENYLPVIIEPNLLGIKVVSESEKDLDLASKIIEKMSFLAESDGDLDEQLASYLVEIANKREDKLKDFHRDWVAINAKGKPVSSKTLGQSEYVDSMRNNLVTFAIGPAGTGKTYLAVAMAVQAFKNEEVQRIILTRPAVEAGENLGFLPGDLQTKVDPYMRPLYDALGDLMGYDTYMANLERGVIEVSPLAYMRGRTLDNAFIILDEAQNTTPEQMKMFLTRLGFESKIVVTGDVTQIDLPNKRKSGLIDAKNVLKNTKGIAFVELDESDVVRNSMVQRIINAYEKHDRKMKRDNSKN